MNYLYICEKKSYEFFESIVGTRISSFVSNWWLLISRLIIALIYIGIGIDYYERNEGWSGTNSLYFITVSITTVGYGDFHPSSKDSKIFTAFYAIFGISFVMSNASLLAQYTLLRFQTQLIEYFPTTNYSKSNKKIILTIILTSSLLILGTIFYACNESWTAAQSFYWTVQTMTTVGYGDLNIKYESTRQFSIVFIFICALAFATAIANIKETHEERRYEEMRNIAKARHEVLFAFSDKENDDNDSNTIVKADPTYVLEVLLASKVVDKERDLNKLHDLYELNRDKHNNNEKLSLDSSDGQNIRSTRISRRVTETDSAETDSAGWKVASSSNDDQDKMINRNSS